MDYPQSCEFFLLLLDIWQLLCRTAAAIKQLPWENIRWQSCCAGALEIHSFLNSIKSLDSCMVPIL